MKTTKGKCWRIGWLLEKLWSLYNTLHSGGTKNNKSSYFSTCIRVCTMYIDWHTYVWQCMYVHYMSLVILLVLSVSVFMWHLIWFTALYLKKWYYYPFHSSVIGTSLLSRENLRQLVITMEVVAASVNTAHIIIYVHITL